MLRILKARDLKSPGKATFFEHIYRNKNKNRLFAEITITTKDGVDVQEFEHKLLMLCLVRMYDMVIVKEVAGQVHYHGIFSYPRLTLLDEVNNEKVEGKLIHDYLGTILMIVPIPGSRYEEVKKRYARKSNMNNTKIPRWGTLEKWIDYCIKGLPTTDPTKVPSKDTK